MSIISCLALPIQLSAKEQTPLQAPKQQMVDFVFKEKELQDIINEYVKKRGANITYTPTTLLTAKVSFNGGKLPFDQAWSLVLKFVEQAGFSLIEETSQSYRLIAHSDMPSTVLPIYINTAWQELPDNEERIRYIYYFENISVTSQMTELIAVLKMMFPATGFDSAVLLEPSMNGIIFTSKASLIKSAMYVMCEFDEGGERETVEVLPLQHTQAVQVAPLLMGLISGSDGQAPKTGLLKTTKHAQYFASTTKVVSLLNPAESGTANQRMQASLNKLVILGKDKDVKHVIDFIKKHIDVPLDKGKSLFHVLDLEWISAAAFTAIIKGLVTSSASGQSKSTTSSDIGFDPKLVITPEVSKGQNADASGSGAAPQGGGNRVLVACTERDWLRIQDIAKQVDVPQKQVVIEGLILDLSLTLSRSISSQLRSKGLVASIFPKYMRAQAAMTINHVLNPNVMTGSAQNQLIGPAAANATLEGDLVNILTGLGTNAAGSTIATIGNANGTGVWAFFQLLSQHKHTKVISRPFTIAQNNQQAIIKSAETRYLASKVSASSTSPVGTYVPSDAPTTITFTPLISDNKTTSLTVDIQISSWQGTGDTSQQTARQLTNKLILKDGEVVVLGGHTKNSTGISSKGIPLLDKIPVVNLFTSSKSYVSDEDVLLILLRATVTEPRYQGGVGAVTARFADTARCEILTAEEEIDATKDPITRWMFNLHDAQTDDALSSTYSMHMNKQQAMAQPKEDAPKHEAKKDIQHEIKKQASPVSDEAQDIQLTHLKKMLAHMEQSPVNAAAA